MEIPEPSLQYILGADFMHSRLGRIESIEKIKFYEIIPIVNSDFQTENIMN